LPFEDDEKTILLSPDDRLRVLPVPPIATSRGLAWSSVRAEHFRDTPDFELDLPGQTHHLLALYIRPPMETRFRGGGLDWHEKQPAGSILVVPAGIPRQAFWRGPVEAVHVHLDPQVMVRTAAETFELEPARVELPPLGALEHPDVKATMLLMDAELGSGGLGSQLLAESLANALAVHLIRHITGNRASGHSSRGGLPRKKLCDAIDYIDAHLDTDISLDELASVTHLSPYHFARQFKVSTGLPPHQYLIARRVERAKHLLQGGHFTLAQVASRTGFWDQGHFTRHFKRLTGTTPKRFHGR
jgi:AraC family transcriptional regulator